MPPNGTKDSDSGSSEFYANPNHYLLAELFLVEIAAVGLQQWRSKVSSTAGTIKWCHFFRFTQERVLSKGQSIASWHYLSLLKLLLSAYSCAGPKCGPLSAPSNGTTVQD